jgi:CheY-like chemotaxis protein
MIKKSLVGMNILVVEDDEVLRTLLCDYLEESGSTVFQAANGLIGFQIIEKEKVDFVLSDIQMPVMDGLELLKKIRVRDPNFPPVLFITGQCDFNIHTAIASGASGLMQKPFRISDIITKIEQLLLTSKAS